MEESLNKITAVDSGGLRFIFKIFHQNNENPIDHKLEVPQNLDQIEIRNHKKINNSN